MLTDDEQQCLLREYDRLEPKYRDLAATAAELISRFVSAGDIQVHSVTGRAKTHGSLAGKIARPDKEYPNLSAITDLAGIRITTYFSQDVDRVASLIEAEFAIDPDNSIDKRRLHDPDRFGYMSLHYVATLSSPRCMLAEYSRLHGLKFEVQIRSILQHAWAEMEHDLGYKTKLGVPKDIRRRFARLAGLLELADDEFCGMREALQAYEKDVAQQIKRDADDVEINKISLMEFINSDPELDKLDNIIAQAGRTTLNAADLHLVERYVTSITQFGIVSVGDLQRQIRDRFALTAAFAQIWLENRPTAHMKHGIGLFYLCYLLVAETRDMVIIGDYVKRMKFGDEAVQKRLVDRIVATYDQAVSRVHQFNDAAVAARLAVPQATRGRTPRSKRPTD